MQIEPYCINFDKYLSLFLLWFSF